MINWRTLPPKKKFKLEIRAINDIIFFAESPYFCGLKLWKKQEEILRNFNQKNPTNGRRIYNELVLQAGMRSSKTFIGGLQTAWEFFKLATLQDPARHYGLARGSEIFMINVAPREEQARDTIFAQTVARIKENPWFQQHDEINILKMRVEFKPKNLYILAAGCNSASVVGRTCKMVSFDELNKFKDNEQKQSAEEMYALLSKSTGTFLPFNENIRYVCGSPLYLGDPVNRLYELSKTIPTMLGYQLATWEINPNIDRNTPEMIAEYRKNPDKFMREYGGIAISATGQYFKRYKLVKKTLNIFRPKWEVDYNTLKLTTRRNPMREFRWAAAGDPSYKGDAFGFAVGHSEFKKNGQIKIIIDYHDRWTPIMQVSKLKNARRLYTEIDPEMVKTFFTNLIDSGIPLSAVMFDTYAFPSVIKAIQERGVPVYQNFVELEEYETLKDFIYSKNLEISFKKEEFNVVEDELLKLTRIGKRVDHPLNGSKDVADAIANLVYYLSGEFEKKKRIENIGKPCYGILLGK